MAAEASKYAPETTDSPPHHREVESVSSSSRPLQLAVVNTKMHGMTRGIFVLQVKSLS